MVHAPARLAATVLIVAALPLPALAQDAGDPLIGHWRLDETTGQTAGDSSNRGNHGTLVNDLGATTDSDGGPAWSADAPSLQFSNPGSLGFDGYDDYVTVPLQQAVGSVTNTFTMAFWAKPSATRAPGGAGGWQSGQRYAIYPHWDYALDETPLSGWNHSGAGVSVGTNGITVFEIAPFFITSVIEHGATLADWTHIAVVYQDGVPTLFVNGVQVMSGQPTLKVVHPSPTLGSPCIPAANGYPDHNNGDYQGLLDDVRIYNAARTPAQIAALAAGFDDMAPATVALQASATSAHSITVTWPAPEPFAGQSASGSVTMYDLRHSATGAIDTEAKFSAATQILAPFPPSAPGTQEAVVLSGLHSQETHFFCLKSANAVSYRNTRSPSASVMTLPDVGPPAAVTLAITSMSGDSVTLEWTAPGDDGSGGETAASYDLRYSDASPIGTDADFAAAFRWSEVPLPAQPGRSQTCTLRNLRQYATYSFALKTLDWDGSASALSNSPTVRMLAGGSSGMSCGSASTAVPAASALLLTALLIPGTKRRIA